MSNLTQIINQELFESKGYAAPWSMTLAEKFTLDGFLSRLNPSVSIEIGAAFGGSLQVIQKYSQTVYSVDIEEDRIQKLKKDFSRVHFLCGSSGDVLPKVIQAEKEIGFVLIDGDHSYEGVQKDLALFCDYVPKSELYIIMHDSFNPLVRKGIVDFDWNQMKALDYLEIDFVQGIFHDQGKWEGSMWGGFALAKFTSSGAGRRLISSHHQRLFNSCYQKSVHFPQKRSWFDFSK